MLFLCIFKIVFALDPFQHEIYLIKQNQETLQFELVSDTLKFIIDLNNQLSVTESSGDTIQCQSYYQCQYCKPNCTYAFVDYNDNYFNGTLQEQIINLTNYKNEFILEEFVSLKGNQNQLGLGQLNNQNNINFTIPQNPFISNVFSICFAKIGYFHKKNQDSFNYIEIPYILDQNQYTIQMNSLQLSKDIIFDLNNRNISFDNINPYTEIPNELFYLIYNYYKQMGFVENNGHLLIHKNKLYSKQFDNIKFFINSTFFIEYNFEQQLYYYGDYLELPFKKTNKQKLILGNSLFNQLYLTINQDKSILQISQRQCNLDLISQQEYVVYLFIILICFVVVIISLIFFWRKQQIYQKVTGSKQQKGVIELTNQHSAKELNDIKLDQQSQVIIENDEDTRDEK